jgi:hypothetical protein
MAEQKKRHPRGEVETKLFYVTYRSDNPAYRNYYGHGNNPPDVRRGQNIRTVRAELKRLLPEDVKFESIAEIKGDE